MASSYACITRAVVGSTSAAAATPRSRTRRAAAATPRRGYNQTATASSSSDSGRHRLNAKCALPFSASKADPRPSPGRRATLSLSLSAALALALCFAFAPSPSAAFENDRAMLEEHTPETAFIYATIRAHKVVIFSKSYCPYCRAVKKIFAEEYPQEKPFVVELDGREDMNRIQDAMQHLYGSRTVPQVFVKTHRIGGSDDTIDAHVNGKLRQFLDGGAANFPQRRDHIQSTGYVGGTDPESAAAQQRMREQQQGEELRRRELREREAGELEEQRQQQQQQQQQQGYNGVVSSGGAGGEDEEL